MSLILDALRGRRARSHREGDEGAFADGVPASLGYRPAPKGLSPVTLVVLGLGAIAAGFVGLSALLLFIAPEPAAPTRAASPADRPTSAARSTELFTRTDGEAGTAPVGTAAPATSRQAERTPVTAAAEAPSRVRAPVPDPFTARTPQKATSSPAALSVARAAAGPSTSPERAERSPAVPRTVSSAPAAPAAPSRSDQAQSAGIDGNRFSLAVYFQRTGDLDGALAEYQAILQQHSSNVEAHTNVGVLLVDKGQLEDGMRHLRQAIVADPGHARAHNNLGVALMKAGQAAPAAAEFQAALSSEPASIEPLVNLALLRKGAGRLAEARDLLQRAVALDPRNPGSQYNLAIVADESGDALAAAEHYRAFLKFGAVTHADLADRVRARLTALGGI